MDNLDGNLSNAITIEGIVDTSSPGTYIVTYTVSDASSNTTSIARTITIYPDNTPPLITLNGPPTMTIILGGTYTEVGATAMDNLDGNLSNAITIEGIVDTSSPGTYTVTYTVSDALSNTTAVARTITIFPDTTPSYTTEWSTAFMTIILGGT